MPGRAIASYKAAMYPTASTSSSAWEVGGAHQTDGLGLLDRSMYRLQASVNPTTFPLDAGTVSVSNIGHRYRPEGILKWVHHRIAALYA